MARLPHESTSLHEALNQTNLTGQHNSAPFQMDDLESDPHYIEELALLERQNSVQTKKRILLLLGVGLLALCALFLWMWYSESQTNVKPVQTPVVVMAETRTVPTETTVPATMPQASIVKPEIVKPITTPIPTDKALAAEELDRITAENKQLTEQASLLEKQVAQTKALIEMKSKLLVEKQQQEKVHP